MSSPRILGAVTAVTLVLPHRDPSLASTMEEPLSISIYLNVESSITFLTQGYFNTIAIVVIFNYESSITFLTHNFLLTTTITIKVILVILRSLCLPTILRQLCVVNDISVVSTNPATIFLSVIVVPQVVNEHKGLGAVDSSHLSIPHRDLRPWHLRWKNCFLNKHI